MKASFYKQLQDDFVTIRFLQYPSSWDQEKYDAAVLSIREARKKINQCSAPAEKKILLYCIDTLFAVLNEGDEQKSYAFADAIHNIPEIYMQKRNLYSFQKELKSFQKKYGKQYFPFIDEVKPHFTKKKGTNWGLPKNAAAYFDPRYDDEFKAKHPILYWLTIVAIVAIVMIGPAIYLVLCSKIQSTMSFFEFVFWLIGFVCSFGISIGFCNLFMIVHKQYLGHYVTIGSFAVGIVGSAIGLFFMWII